MWISNTTILFSKRNSQIMKYNYLLRRIRHVERSSKHIFEEILHNTYIIFHYHLYSPENTKNKNQKFSIHYIFTSKDSYHIYYQVGEQRTSHPKIYLGEYCLTYPQYILDEMFEDMNLEYSNIEAVRIKLKKITKRTYLNNAENLKQNVYIKKSEENPREISNEKFV